MTIVQSLLAFVLAASILTITPGVDNAMVLRSAAGSGSRAAVGISLGCLIWGALVSVGLGALLTASPLASAAQMGGRGVSVVDGDPADRAAAVRLPRAAPRHRAIAGRRCGAGCSPICSSEDRRILRDLPAAIRAVGVSVAGFSFLLAGVHVLLGLAWFALLIAATRPLGRWLATPEVVRRMDRLTGGVFVGFGVRLALTR